MGSTLLVYEPKKLRSLQQSGLIKIVFVNMENAKENTKISEKISAGFTVGVSCLDGKDVIVNEASSKIYDSIRELIGRNNYQDARQLEAHFRSGNNIFVSEDKNDILTYKNELKEMGILVMSPDELEEYVKELGINSPF